MSLCRVGATHLALEAQSHNAQDISRCLIQSNVQIRRQWKRGLSIRSSRYQQPRTGYFRRLIPKAGMDADANHAIPKELNESADFAAIANNGLVSICGFGSLLSEKSARSTFPNLLNFRAGVLRNFRRIFAHVAPVFLERGIANMETKEMSSLSVEPCAGETIVVTVFEISVVEVPSFIEREHEFRFLAVTIDSLDGNPFPQSSVICSKYSDEEYFRVRCKGNKDVYNEHYGRHGIDKIWRDDILPCRLYLRHCVLASKQLGQQAYESFLDHTYLGDRKTSIRLYLRANPSIMEEKPPSNLLQRYGG